MPIPPTTDVHRLVEVLDDIVTQRPRHRSVPILFMRSETRPAVARETVEGYKDRLVGIGRNQSLVPYAYIAGQRPGDARADLGLLDNIARQLENNTPRSAGSLNLHEYWLIRDAMDAQPGDGSRRVQRRKVRDHLFDVLRQRHGSIGWLAGLSDHVQVTPLQTTIAALAMRLPRFLYGVWLERTTRFRWLTKKIAKTLVEPSQDFLGCCVQIAAGGPVNNNGALMQQILVDALLRDLTAAGKKSRLSVVRRRRSWSPVLLFDDLGDVTGPVRRFCDTSEEIARQRPIPVVVLVACHEAPPYAVAGRPDHTQGDGISAALAAARAIRTLRDGPGRGETTALAVELPAEATDPAAARWLAGHPTVPAHVATKVDWWFPIITAVLLALLLIPLGWLVWWGVTSISDDHCRHVVERDGEQIGISDGSCTLLARDEATRDVMRRIADENDTAGSEAEQQNIPLRTIVYVTPLVRPGESEDEAITSLQQVRGAYLAQRTANDAPGLVHPVRIQLLLANPGTNFEHGEEVARMIVDLAGGDDSYAPGFAAVAGVSQSWRQSLAAVRILEQARILVVGAAITGDQMSEVVDGVAPPSNYYQVSVNDRRIAPKVSERVPADEKVVVVYSPDEDDLFSGDYAREVEDALGDRSKGATSIPYPPDPDTKKGVDENRAADELCRHFATSGNDKNVVLYASRAIHLKPLLQRAQGKPGCANRPRPISIITSTDIPKLITGGTIDPADYPDFRLGTPVYGEVEEREGGGLGHELKDAYDKAQWPEKRDADAAQGFDAVRFVVEVINDPDTPPNSSYDALLTRLRAATVTLAGATGVISLGKDVRIPNEIEMPIRIIDWCGREPCR